MQTRSLQLSLSLLVTLLVTSGCSAFSLGVKQGGLERVDELLSDVEHVQVEAAVSKERSQGAFERLRTLVAPEFRGDAPAAHAEFVAAVEASEDQAKALKNSLRPLRKTGEAVLERWTADLESFGNVSMRQRSQERLEETRRRYDAVLAAAVAAQLAYDAFNGDLADNALFLEHDFNATSVALIAQDLDGLKSRGRELAKRLDASMAACQAYVEFSAPMAQVSPAEESVIQNTPTEQAEAAPAPKKPTPKKKTTAPQGG